MGESKKTILTSLQKDEESYVCVTCGKSYKRRNYRSTKNPQFAANNGILPVCANCMDKDFKKWIEKFGDETKAFQRLCMHWNIYFNQELFKKVSSCKDVDHMIGFYFTQMNLPQWGEGKKTFDDSIEEEEHSAIDTVEEFQEKKINDLPKRVFKAWGAGYEIEEYVWMEDEYTSWISRANKEKLTKSLESNIREICRIGIDIKRARANPGTKPSELVRLQEVQLKYMESAGLKPIQEDTSVNLLENIPLGVQIKHWEKDEPVPEYPEENKIKTICDIYYKGHLARVADLPNDTLDEYKKEMAKYNIEVNEEDDVEEINEQEDIQNE